MSTESLSDAVRCIAEEKEKGNACFKSGAYEAALVEYDAALAHAGTPETTAALSIVASNKAECLLRLKRWDAAAAACDQALSFTPSAWKPLWRKGRALQGCGRLSASLEHFENAAALCDGSAANKESILATIAEVQETLKVPENFMSTCVARIQAKGSLGDCVDQLMSRGYAVVDDYFHATHADEVLAEVKHLVHRTSPRSYLAPNRTYFKNDAGTVTPFDKPHVFEVDLHGAFTGTDTVAAEYPRLDALFSAPDIPQALEESGAGELLFDKDAGQRAIKLQWNEGGGSFPWHIDNPGNNKRRVTCVVYLNKAWKAGDGGEIALLPFLGDEEVVVAPRFNRAVFFLSEVMSHKVLPAVAERYCFSIWYDRHKDSPQNFDHMYSSPLPLLKQHLPTQVKFLQKPSTQRTLARLVYEEEYLETLDTCMPDKTTESYKGLLKMHTVHVEGIRKANAGTPLLDTIETLRSLKGGRQRVYLE